jgi:hypothetical protein
VVFLAFLYYQVRRDLAFTYSNRGNIRTSGRKRGNKASSSTWRIESTTSASGISAALAGV